MTDDEIKRIYRHARLSAKQLNFSSYEDDLAHDVFVAFLSNKDSKQTVKQACIDSIRKQFGQTRNEKKGIKKLRGSKKQTTQTHFTIDALKLVGSESKDIERFQEYESLKVILSIDTSLSPTEKKVLDTVLQGYENVETAKLLKMSLGTVQCHLSRIRSKLKKVYES